MAESSCKQLIQRNGKMQNLLSQEQENKIKYHINREIAVTILELVQRKRQFNGSIIASIVCKWHRKVKSKMKIDMNIVNLMEHAKMVYDQMTKPTDSIIIWYLPLEQLNISWRDVQTINTIKKMKNGCDKCYKISIGLEICAVIMKYIVNIECMNNKCSRIVSLTDYPENCNTGNVKRSVLCNTCGKVDNQNECGYNHTIDEMALGTSNQNNCDICYNNLCISSCPSIQTCSCKNKICLICAQKDYNVGKCGRCNINICYLCWIEMEVSDSLNAVMVIKICWDCREISGSKD